MAKGSAVSSYRQVGSAEASYATPHRLVQMLMGGALDRIMKAKGNVLRNEPEARHKDIQWTITVIDALRGSLDFEHGGEIAANLDLLYDYMNRRLNDADINNDAEPLDEVESLLKEIKEAWDAMPDTLRNAADITEAAKHH
jgi:flagellar protein FliS